MLTRFSSKQQKISQTSQTQQGGFLEAVANIKTLDGKEKCGKIMWTIISVKVTKVSGTHDDKWAISFAIRVVFLLYMSRKCRVQTDDIQRSSIQKLRKFWYNTITSAEQFGNRRWAIIERYHITENWRKITKTLKTEKFNTKQVPRKLRKNRTNVHQRILNQHSAQGGWQKN